MLQLYRNYYDTKKVNLYHIPDDEESRKSAREHEPIMKKGFRASLVQNFFHYGTLLPGRPLCIAFCFT